MLRKDILKSGGPGSTAEPAEIARFEALAAEWWKPDGAFRMVHAFNACRVAHLSRNLPELVGRVPDSEAPLAGLSLLDVGCGAGLVAEPMARLGATVTGLDAAERNIAIASAHARRSGLTIDYRHGLPEDLASEDARFDILLTLEVVEHVADVERFLAACARLLKPGGVMVVGTLNRTVKSYALAIAGAEYVLGWLPKGTHDWRKFVTPAELNANLASHGLVPAGLAGVAFDPIRWRWRIAKDASVNYLAAFRHEPGHEAATD